MTSIHLQCLPGTTVYKIWSCGRHGYSVAEFTVVHIDIDNYPKTMYTLEKAGPSPWTKGKPRFYAFEADFGKTIFLDKKDAETAASKKSCV